jgi:hypothetical protein
MEQPDDDNLANIAGKKNLGIRAIFLLSSSASKNVFLHLFMKRR